MNEPLNFLYDHQADVLYVSKGQPVYTDSVALSDQVILRTNPATGEIMGFSIVDFIRCFANKETPSSVPLTATFKRRTRISKAVKPSRKKKSK
jgi:uncharacterized protein YuzE